MRVETSIISFPMWKKIENVWTWASIGPLPNYFEQKNPPRLAHNFYWSTWEQSTSNISYFYLQFNIVNFLFLFFPDIFVYF